MCETSFYYFINLILIHIKNKKQQTSLIYHEWHVEDGLNYCTQKISEIEKQLMTERDARRHYKRGVKGELIIQTELILH